MVCIYCQGRTRVTNSRHQKKSNQVWRRRVCLVCEAIFTTTEGVDMTGALRVRKTGTFEPFSRDKLFLSINDSLRHRKTALEDATALTATILSQLYPFIENAVLDLENITKTSTSVLERFDQAAATHYRAFHPT